MVGGGVVGGVGVIAAVAVAVTVAVAAPSSQTRSVGYCCYCCAFFTCCCCYCCCCCAFFTNEKCCCCCAFFFTTIHSSRVRCECITHQNGSCYPGGLYRRDAASAQIISALESGADAGVQLLTLLSHRHHNGNGLGDHELGDRGPFHIIVKQRNTDYTHVQHSKFKHTYNTFLVSDMLGMSRSHDPGFSVRYFSGIY